MAQVQIIPGNFNITDPDWPTVKILETLTSDTFSPRDPFIGSMTDCGLGGTPMEWTGDAAGGFAIVDGALLSSQSVATRKAKLEGLPADMSVAFTVAGLDPAGGALTVSFRTSADENDRVRVLLRQDSGIIIEERAAGTTTNQSALLANTFAAGDRVKVDLKGSTVTLSINGNVIAEHQVARTTAGSFALSSYPVARIPIDNLVITEV